MGLQITIERSGATTWTSDNETIGLSHTELGAKFSIIQSQSVSAYRGDGVRRKRYAVPAAAAVEQRRPNA